MTQNREGIIADMERAFSKVEQARSKLNVGFPAAPIISDIRAATTFLEFVLGALRKEIDNEQ